MHTCEFYSKLLKNHLLFLSIYQLVIAVFLFFHFEIIHKGIIEHLVFFMFLYRFFFIFYTFYIIRFRL